MTSAQDVPPKAVFEALETALSQSQFGRSFLEEVVSRSRENDITRLLRGFEDLKDAVSNQRSSTQLDILRGELKGMVEAIDTAKKDIASIEKPDLPQSRISAATEELDAIVTSTERATSDILGTAERLSEMAQKMREAESLAPFADELDGQVMHIFTACSFQDITGQRINKVVNVLHYLENRLNSMLAIWGAVTPQGEQSDPKGLGDQPYNPMDTRPDAHLLTGPALEGQGVSQDDVDRMLNGEAPEADASSEIEVAAPVEVASAETPAPAPSPEPASAEEDEGVVIGQDEIDNLFSDEDAA